MSYVNSPINTLRKLPFNDRSLRFQLRRRGFNAVTLSTVSLRNGKKLKDVLSKSQCEYVLGVLLKFGQICVQSRAYRSYIKKGYVLI